MPNRFQHFDTRQKMKGDSYEIFYYQDRHLGPVALHHHDFYEVYFFLGGSVDYLVEGQTYQLQPGDLLLISPLELHQPIIHPDRDPYQRIVLWIKPEFLHRYSTAGTSLVHCFDISRPAHTNLLRLAPQQQELIRQTLDELLRHTATDQFGRDILCQALLLQFLVQLNRQIRDGSGTQEPEKESRLTDRVIAYIGDHYAQPLSLDGLAEEFFVSKYHLSHEFARVMGVSVYRYITLKRLLIARQMLTTGLRPSVVYEACGFRDYAGFYRAFKAEYGCSPTEFTQT